MTVAQPQRETLQTRGLVKIEGLIPVDEVRVARDMIRSLATEHGLLVDGIWRRSQTRFAVDKGFRKALRSCVASKYFPEFISETLLKQVEDIVGTNVQALSPGQQILFSLPETATWSVPHNVWHVDAPRLGPHGPPGYQIFTFLDEVKTFGGGTLVVAGSHRLENPPTVLRSRDLKGRLARQSYFKTLFNHQRLPITDLRKTAGQAAGVDLEIVELTGQPGDAFIMDLRALHAPAINGSDKARMMLTCRLPRAEVARFLADPNLLNDV